MEYPELEAQGTEQVQLLALHRCFRTAQKCVGAQFSEKGEVALSSKHICWVLTGIEMEIKQVS